MGLNANEIQVLIDTSKQRNGLGKVITLGHQWLLCEPSDVRDLLRKNQFSESDIETLLRSDLTYIDGLLKLIGADSVDSMDFSEYENANIVHDLNKPLPEKYWGTYDLVLDGGTIEHVFHVPEALRTCMRLCKVGGVVYLTSPSNNQCGHGFYQFSPELMFRSFSAPNGFDKITVYAAETFPRNRCKSGLLKEIQDPLRIKQRIILDAGMPVQMITVAWKARDADVFHENPLQSDYMVAWDQNEAVNSGHQERSGIKAKILDLLDKRFMRLGQVVRTLLNPLNNARYYQ